MTIASETNRSGPYACNGATTSFPYEFRIYEARHIRVILTDASGTETGLSLASDYTVSGVGNDGGGVVSTAEAYASGYQITLILNVPFTQEMDLENQGAYFAETIERAFDLLTQMSLQLKELIGRAVVMPVTSTTSVDALVAAIVALDTIRTQMLALVAISDDIETVASISDEVVAAEGNANAASAAAGAAALSAATATTEAAAAAASASAAAESASSVDLTGYAKLSSPHFTDNPTAPTRAGTDSSTSLATTAQVWASRGYIPPVTSLAEDTVLAAPAAFGIHYRIFNATDISVTLPPVANNRGVLEFSNPSASGGSGILTVPDGYIREDGVSVSSIRIRPGEAVVLYSDNTRWTVASRYRAPLPSADWLIGTSEVEAPISPAKLAAAIGDLVVGVPISGEIYWPVANTLPEGFLEENGAALSRTAYPELFAAIGTTWGAGDGSTTFNLPDARGEFIRVWDNGRGVDSGRGFGSGSSQSYQNAAHSHTAQMYSAGNGSGSGAQSRDSGTGGSTLTTSSVGGAEARPRNVPRRLIMRAY